MLSRNYTGYKREKNYLKHSSAIKQLIISI